MWIALGSAAGLLVGLVAGFWIGHRFGYELCESDIQAKIGALDRVNNNDDLVKDIRWAYSELLFRQPLEREVIGWASVPRPLEEICKAFAASIEYARLSPDLKTKARISASLRGIQLPR